MNVYQYALRCHLANDVFGVVNFRVSTPLETFDAAVAAAQRVIADPRFSKVEVCISPTPFWEVVEVYTSSGGDDHAPSTE